MKTHPLLEAINKSFEAGSSVVLVTGPWGIGKTTAIRTYLQSIEQNYIRITAMGISDSNQFSEKIALSAIKKGAGAAADSTFIDRAKELTALHSSTKEWSDIGWKTLCILGYESINGMTVWIDDLERIDDDLVPFVLGEVLNLIESKECKVILAATDEFFARDKDWHDILEKVVTTHIKFQRDINEVIDIGFENTVDCKYLKSIIRDIGIQNIRAIKRIASYYEIGFGREFTAPELIKEQVANTIAIGVSSKYSLNKLIPSIEKLVDWQVSYLPKSSKDELAKQQNDFMMMLRYSETDDLDRALLAFIDSGIPDKERIQFEIKKKEKLIRFDEGRKKYQAIWGEIHGEFGLDIDAVHKRFCEVITGYPESFHPKQYNEVVSLFKGLGDSNRLESILYTIPSIIMVAKSQHRFDMSFGERYEFEKEISDRISFEEDSKQSISGLVQTIAEKSSWNPDDLDTLSSRTLEEYVSFLEADKTGNLSSYIRLLFGFGGNQENSSTGFAIAQKLAKALRIISQKSELNQIAVRKWFALMDIFDPQPVPTTAAS